MTIKDFFGDDIVKENDKDIDPIYEDLKFPPEIDLPRKQLSLDLLLSKEVTKMIGTSCSAKILL